uniref:RING-type domain-containing protein n=1 Tax=viral metagenome TaxID=1070528 RepID=A0A6C0D0W2_9ZZZZ
MDIDNQEEDLYNYIPLIPQPKNVKINLFRHQLASVYQMEKLEREQVVHKNNRIIETKIGIQSDPTGYGKTISMIALIARDKMEWDLSVPFIHEYTITESAGLIKSRNVKRLDKIPTTLILMSSSIIHQWEKELKYTDLKVSVLTNKNNIDTIDPWNYDVVLVTPSMYNRLIGLFSKIAWKRFIFDEPGHLKVPSMKQVYAGFVWLISATPSAITPHHRNCRNSFMKDIIGTGWWDFETNFGGMIIRNNLEFVKASFAMPSTHYYYHNCYQPIFNAVHGFISVNVSTMIEAGNIEGAIIALGGNKTSNIIDLVKRKKLEELEEIETKIRIYTIRNDQERMNEWVVRKDKIMVQLEELDKRFNNMLSNTCNICLDNITRPVLEPNCQNLFCGECLLKWLQKSDKCPLCRTTIDNSDLVYVATDNSDEDTMLTNYTQEERPMTKIEKIVDIIMKKQNGKFLVFSAYDITFENIYDVLCEKNITCGIIKGSFHTREKIINGFKKGNIKVIFLNSTFNGAGINLQEATDIILYHEMTADMQTQILGRSLRLGRTEDLHVHQLQISDNI